MYRAIEVRGLPAELVDPLGGGGRAAEHRRFHRLDVSLEPLDHGRVIVADLVQPRPPHSSATLLPSPRPALEPFPAAAKVARRPRSHNDDEARRPEQPHLTALDLAAAVAIPRGPEDGQ